MAKSAICTSVLHPKLVFVICSGLNPEHRTATAPRRRFSPISSVSLPFFLQIMLGLCYNFWRRPGYLSFGNHDSCLYLAASLSLVLKTFLMHLPTPTWHVWAGKNYRLTEDRRQSRFISAWRKGGLMPNKGCFIFV